MSRDELIAKARALGVERPELMTRVELGDEIVRRTQSDPGTQRSARGWLGIARDMVASVVESGLNLPDAAALIRGERLDLDMRGPSPVATVTLAEIYATQGHVERALQMVDEVLAKEPDHAAAQSLRSRLLATPRRGTYAAKAPESVPPESMPAESMPQEAPAVAEASQPPPPPIAAPDAEPEPAPFSESETATAVRRREALAGLEARRPDTMPAPAESSPPASEEQPSAQETVEFADSEPVSSTQNISLEFVPGPAEASLSEVTEPNVNDVAPEPDLTDPARSPDTAVGLEPPLSAPNEPDPLLLVLRTRRPHPLVCWSLSEELLAELSGNLELECVGFVPGQGGAERREFAVTLDSSRGSLALPLFDTKTVLRVAVGHRDAGAFVPLVIASELEIKGDCIDVRYRPPLAKTRPPSERELAMAAEFSR